MKTIQDLDLKNKTVFLRVDFNVPVIHGGILNNKRIIAALPTIQLLLEKGATLIIASHLGRPKTSEDRKALSMQPIAVHLQRLLEREVQLAPDSNGSQVQAMVKELKPGDILLLENLRFDPREKANDRELAKEWASYADYYINDAFGTCHREHASTAAITKHLPSAIGLLIEAEMKHLKPVMKDPKRPLLVIIGGAKLSTKLNLVKNLLTKVDKLFIGGAMMFTFYKAQGLEIGKSLVEEDFVEQAKELLNNPKIVLPTDVVISHTLDGSAGATHVQPTAIPKDMYGVDIGKKSIELLEQLINNAQTIVWNGPLGIFEVSEFAQGTRTLMELLAKSKAVTIVGGGDSVAAVTEVNLEKEMTHVSTGGGATLRYFEKGTLPALELLENNALKKAL